MKDWTAVDMAHERYEHWSLCKVAERLHMTVTGGGDLTDLEARALRLFLQMRLDTWQASIPRCQRYDDAVREVCRAALQESMEADYGSDASD